MNQETARHEVVLGVRFFVGNVSETVAEGCRGGLVVVPAAPAMVLLEADRSYRDALYDADVAITDNGLLVLLWRMLSGKQLPRVSGLAYLKELLAREEFRNCGSSFWVMPTEALMRHNLEWLRSQGCAVDEDACYVAPFYGAKPVEDPDLAARVEAARPRHVVICLGGGTQEKLGLDLRERLSYRPSIHCIGAAIGFLSGDQANIPAWADRAFLGWLMRCLTDPKRFVPRYLAAFRLVPILARHRSARPPLRRGG